jgi:hypothetical protein
MQNWWIIARSTKILVPYVLQFDDEAKWEVLKDIGGWGDGVRKITDRRTADVAMH